MINGLQGAWQDPFWPMFHELHTHGAVRSPRGMETIEIEDYTYTLPPYKRLMTYPNRKLSLQYIKDEIRWYLRGDPLDLSICEKAAIWKTAVTNNSLNSNYGYYLFRQQGLDIALDFLVQDEDSRRAVVPILSHRHMFSSNNDVPCTETIAFRIREGQLRCTVHMRSQDAVYGAGNDVPFFGLVHEMALIQLNEFRSMRGMPLLDLGSLTTCVTSFHAYKRHWDLVKSIALGEEKLELSRTEMPRLRNLHEVLLVRTGAIGAAKNMGCPFSSWLETPEFVQ